MVLSTDVALRARGLTKSFGDHTAVRAVDLNVGRGSLYGLAGPNGAGRRPHNCRRRAAEQLATGQAFRAEASRTLVVDYSTGMRKKVGLALAMLHAPGLLVLDEPLEAVDPVSAATLKQVLRGYVDAGGSVLFSSHVMPVVEQLCDHVAVVADGEVVADGRLDDVRGERTLEEAFVDLVGGGGPDAELAWLRP